MKLPPITKEISPVAKYLRLNKAISVKDSKGCSFISPEGLYLGRLTKSIVNNYTVISTSILGENCKKMYTNSVAIGHQFAYIKNNSAPLGVSLLPVKTYMRKIFVDFINSESNLTDTERNLCNQLNLIAIDENTSVGLYDTQKPFKYTTKILNEAKKTLKHPIFKFTKN